MKTNRLRHIVFAVAIMGGVSIAGAAPLGTGFTYQGQLKEGGSPANGTYDLQFKLFDAAGAGAQVGPTIQLDNVNVTHGLFNVPLDFGARFEGDARWLEVAVHAGALPPSDPYTLLTPRQALTATPYAMGLRLPLSQTVTTSSDAINVTNAGTGDCGQFNITDPSNVGEAVEGRTAGGGDSIQGINTGTGRAGFFQIDNAANSAPALYTTTNGTGPGLRVQSGADTLDIDTHSINTDGDGFFGDPLNLNNDTTSNVLIGFGGGNVGIGGGAAGFPAARLHVDGGTDTTPAAGGYLVLGNTTSTNIAMDNNEIMARNDGLAATLAFNASGGNVTLIQSGTGGVSIGTTALPTGVLLAVDGKVLCEELEVQLSQDWPDYVFGDSYALMPLNELEKSIEQNGHLPGVPSAAQVAEKGLNVGKMQATTLQKVEELTLYVLQINTELQALRQENRELQRRIASMETVRRAE